MDAVAGRTLILLGHTRLGRVGGREKAARLIACGARDDTDRITGQIIYSRGGL